MLTFTSDEIAALTERRVEFLKALDKGFEEGRGLKEVLAEHKIPYTTYRTWKRAHTIFANRCYEVMLKHNKVTKGSPAPAAFAVGADRTGINQKAGVINPEIFDHLDAFKR